MALVSIKESGSSPRSGSLTVGSRSYTRTIVLTTDSTADNVVSIYGYLASLGIYWGQYYLITDDGGTLVNYDTGAFIIGIHPEQSPDTPYLWHVRIEYGPYQLPGGQHPTGAPARSGGDPQQNPNIEPNPLLRPAILHWTTVPHQELLAVDADGKPVRNSAEQPFTGRRPKERKRFRLSITRNEATFSAAAFDPFLDTTNALTFLHAQPGQAKMSDISGRSVTEGAIGRYYEVTYLIDFARLLPSGPVYKDPAGNVIPFGSVPPWDEILLDQGRTQIVGGVRKPCDIGGRPATVDALLDGAGVQLVVGATAVYIDFADNPSVDWTILALV